MVLASLAGGAAVLARWPGVFELDNERGLPWSLPIWGGAIWIQLAIGFATAVVCVGITRRPRMRAWTAALLPLGICDLLLAQPYGIQPTGLDVSTIPAEAIRPSVHAVRLAAGLLSGRQRLLAPAGTQVDAVVPAAFARVWEIPIAGGYGPMLLARHSALAMMGTNGSVDPLVLADDNTALDLLAVKYIVVREEDLASAPTFERDGVDVVITVDGSARWTARVRNALPAHRLVRAATRRRRRQHCPGRAPEVFGRRPSGNRSGAAASERIRR